MTVTDGITSESFCSTSAALITTGSIAAIWINGVGFIVDNVDAGAGPAANAVAHVAVETATATRDFWNMV
jgi:hypothetical protein